MGSTCWKKASKNYEKVCEMCYITINISAIFGDKGAISRGGVRIGTPAMTTKRLPRGEPGGKAATPWVWCHTRGSKGFVGGWSFHVIRKKKEEKRKKKKEKRRGFLEADFETIADFLVKAAQCTSGVQREHEKSQKDFLKGLRNCKDIVELRNRVETFASQFAMPRFDI
ncbi:serine hydroxymethyltransferase 7-like isoform X2 [Malania oleifera]|uniref:serine hydroxymethyltransferase 7-like isoform X2 n=1 Tax=Malania oleifera TaxID=397392 RepID=UPI0025AE6EB9|nr:serine hydroxymethyltransferase 7-like isoform X2 [Malania oleifera]XP_057973770.1 serine hydroxymethyltransferase 7-like isoform X2 [Malania oleifera]